MAGMFYFSSLFLYAKFRLSFSDSPGKKLLPYAGCLVSVFFCYLAKPTSATLPAAIALYEIFFGIKSREEIKKISPYLIPIVLSAVIPVLLARFDAEESRNIGIRLTPYYLPYYYTKLRVLARALGLMVLPLGQRIEYNFIMSTSFGSPVTTFYSLLLHLSLLTFAVFGFRRHKVASFCILWFYLALSVTTILFLDDLFFEHYLYIPLYSYCLALPVYSLKFARRFNINKRAWVIFLVFLTLFYATLSHRRNRVWGSEIFLWEDAVKKSPRDARANYTLGVYYFRAGRLKKALESYEKALRLKPDYPEAYYRLGQYYYTAGEPEKSIENYVRALGLNPDFFEAYAELGSVYLSVGENRRAKVCYSRALELTDNEELREKIKNIMERTGSHE